MVWLDVAGQPLAVYVASHHQLERHRHDVRRVEAGIDVRQTVEAPDQQTGAAQEHERECHLRRDERVAQEDPPPASRRAAAAFLQRLDRIAA